MQLLRRYICAKKVQTLNLSTKKFHAKLSYEKSARKMLVKLTPGVKWKNTGELTANRRWRKFCRNRFFLPIPLALEDWLGMNFHWEDWWQLTTTCLEEHPPASDLKRKIKLMFWRSWETWINLHFSFGLENKCGNVKICWCRNKYAFPSLYLWKFWRVRDCIFPPGNPSFTHF